MFLKLATEVWGSGSLPQAGWWYPGFPFQSPNTVMLLLRHACHATFSYFCDSHRHL